MAAENPSLGEERIAGELALKLQICFLPRTAGKYIERSPRRQAEAVSAGPPSPESRTGNRRLRFFSFPSQRIFRVVYVFVALEIRSRRLVHFHVLRSLAESADARAPPYGLARGRG
jgi:hypothetical protein